MTILGLHCDEPDSYPETGADGTLRLVAIELGLNPAKATQAEILDTLRALRARVMPMDESEYADVDPNKPLPTENG